MPIRKDGIIISDELSEKLHSLGFLMKQIICIP
jgi:hypothetical protein